MRHGNAFRKFTMTAAHRRAMFRNMTTSLFLKEKIETSVWKAKDLRRVAEKLITLAKKDTLHGRRTALSYLKSKGCVHKLFAVIGPRYKTRNGGYTRIVRTGRRHGDAAELAIIELIRDASDPIEAPAPKKEKAPKAKAAKSAKVSDAGEKPAKKTASKSKSKKEE